MTSWRALNRISAPLRRINVEDGAQYGVVLPNVIFRMLNPGKPVPKNEVFHFLISLQIVGFY